MRAGSRVLTALMLAATLGAPLRSTEAAPSGRKAEDALERSQAFVVEGDEALERGDYEEAIGKYSAAYYGLGTEERASYMGSIPVRQAMRAFDLLTEQTQDPAILEQQLALVNDFLRGVEARPDGVDRVGEEVVEELEAARRAAEEQLAALAEAQDSNAIEEPGAGSEEPARVDPIVVVPPSETPARADRPAPSKLGIGLAVAGGVLVGAGAGVMAGWWTVPRQALGYADEAGDCYAEGTAARADYLAREDARAQRYLVAGASVLGVGVAVVTTGVVLVARARRKGGVALRLGPQLGAQQAGVVLGGRF